MRCLPAALAWLCVAPALGGEVAEAQVDRMPPKPAIAAAPDYVFPKVVRRTLPNGLEVAVVERHDLPLVVVRTVFAGGSHVDPPGKEGVFAMMRLLLNQGTERRSATSLAASFETMGNAVTEAGFTTVSGNLDSSLVLLAEMLGSPAFLQSAIDAARNGRLAIARASRLDGNAITTRVFTSALFGPDHPFSRFESEESLSRITRDDIVASHREWIRPGAIKLVIVGDVSATRLFERLATIFGDPEWTGAGGTRASEDPWRPPVSPSPSQGPPPTTIYLVDVPGPTAYIRFATLVAPRDSPEVPALDIVNAVYGALSASRLHRELREKRGLTYAAPSAFQWRAPPARGVLYVTHSSVGRQRADSVVATVLAELNAIGGEQPPTDAEIEFARSNRMASLALQLETHEALARQLADLLQQRLPTDFVTSYYAGLRHATRDDVARAARTQIDRAHTAIVVVGDAAFLEPALRDAGIAPVLRVNPTGIPIR